MYTHPVTSTHAANTWDRLLSKTSHYLLPKSVRITTLMFLHLDLACHEKIVLTSGTTVLGRASMRRHHHLENLFLALLKRSVLLQPRHGCLYHSQ